MNRTVRGRTTGDPVGGRRAEARGGVAQPVTAGIVAAVVGFTSSFAVVLTALQTVGATPDQAASGLLALCLTQAAGILWLARRYRRPISLAWSTPGAALLAGASTVDGGWPAAVGAFAVCGGLLLLTAAWPGLGDLVARIPVPLAQAMLAGVLLPLCVAPATALVDRPGAVAPVVLTWLLVRLLSPRWATPAALVAALVVVAVSLAADGTALAADDLLPGISLTVPSLSWQAVVGIALPLYVVTMASQNVPGVAVMRSLGYEVPWRPAMAVTGLGTLVGASAGGHAINLAAISAALSGGPDAGPDRDRRWIAAVSVGWSYVVLAGLSAALATLVARAPAGVVEAAAGLALLGALAGALRGATADDERREAAVVTFAVAASGITMLGVGSAFWALVAGIVVLLLRPGSAVRRTPAVDPGEPAPPGR